MVFNDSFLNKLIEVNNMAIESTILESLNGGFFGWYGGLLIVLVILYIVFINTFDLEEKLKNILSKKSSYKEEKTNIQNSNLFINLSNNEKGYTNEKYNLINYFKEYLYKSILFLYNDILLIGCLILSVIFIFVFSIIGIINDDKVNDIISENLSDVNLLSDITYSYDIVSVDILKDDETDKITYLVHYQKPNDNKVYNYETETISYSNDSSNKIYFFDSEKVKLLNEYLSEENMFLNIHIKNYFDDCIIEIDNSLLKNK